MMTCRIEYRAGSINVLINNAEYSGYTAARVRLLGLTRVLREVDDLLLPPIADRAIRQLESPLLTE
jgi:hypothetical protein